ncbi:hypothetical protein NRF20_00725 [Streptomyces sp. R-74717]|uniref:hypothetical protein n=1 Tax=Streptomyces TaxID=1883 RepID=UPI0037B0FA8E
MLTRPRTPNAAESEGQTERTMTFAAGYLVAPHLLSVLTRSLTDHHPTTSRLQPSR